MAKRENTLVRQALAAEFPQFQFRVRNTATGVGIYIMSGPMRFIPGSNMELTEVYTWIDVQDQAVIQRMIQTAQAATSQPITAVFQGSRDTDYTVTGSVRRELQELDAQIAELQLARTGARTAIALDAMALDTIQG